MRIAAFPTEGGQVNVAIGTHLAPFPNFHRPVPVGLMAEVSGEAPDIDDAVVRFSRAAQMFLPVITLVANSSTEDLVPELCFDSTPGETERAFFQQFVAAESIRPIGRRRVEGALVHELVQSLALHTESARLHRAVAQYHQALQNWEPGKEILVLAHLWMAVEAMTPVMLRSELARSGLDRAGLAANWSIDASAIDAEVRRRLILHGDAETYRLARRASDGFEHGFLGFPEIHAHSTSLRLTLAGHVRRSIVELLDLSESTAQRLMSEPFASPGHHRFNKYLRGRILGASEDLAEPTHQYPFLEWRTTARDTSEPSASELTVTYDDTFTPHIAASLRFAIDSIEVWGGQESTLRRADA